MSFQRSEEAYTAHPTEEAAEEALAKASVAQARVAAAANAAKPEEKAAEGTYILSGGKKLEPLLATIDLIDVAYLVALGDVLHHLFLPALTLGTVPAAVISRMTRSSLLEVMQEDYVRTARAKGLAERVVVQPAGR